jgi:glutamate/tyrosine decarboxylase-like PLP-dependent enzyme
MHRVDPALAGAVFETALARLGADPPPLGGSLDGDPEPAITPAGLGGERALALLRDVLLPATTAIDHPRYLAFIPGTPVPAASLADLLVSAYSVYGGSWLEGAGAVHAENEALGWLAGLAGFPEGAGG